MCGISGAAEESCKSNSETPVNRHSGVIFKDTQCRHPLQEAQLPLQPAQPEPSPLFFAQIAASGQPIQVMPRFFDLWIYPAARPRTAAKTTVAMMFSIVLTYTFKSGIFAYFLVFSAYSEAILLSAFLTSLTTTAAIARTAIRPGTKPTPSVPSVIRVPIW